jgi:AbrB family looped-hinge helix DNA binding protein
MSETITLGRAGRLVLPKSLRDRLKLAEGSCLDLEVDGSVIHLRTREETSVKLVNSGGLLVATGFPKGANIAKAVRSERAGREEALLESAKRPKKRKA